MINKLKNELVSSKAFICYSFLKILGEGITFIVPLMIAKILSPSGYGSYSLSMMIIFFFTSAFITSSQTPFIVYSNEEVNKTQKINKAYSIQLFFLLFSIIGFITLLYLFNGRIKSFANISNLQLIFLFLAYVGIGLKSFIENLFLALNEKIKNSLYFLSVGCINLIILLLFYFKNYVNINVIFLIYFLSAIISTFLFLRKIDFNKLSPFFFDKKLFIQMFHWTKWQIMGLTAVYLINWGDNLVLRYFVSMEKIGIYNLGYQIFKGLVSLTFILNSYFLPFISQNIDDNKKIGNYLNNKRPKIMLAGTLGIVFIYLIIPFAFEYIYGNTYKESITIVRILLIGAIIALYNVFYIPILNSLKMYKFGQISNIIHVLINIALNVVLIQIIGIYGAAVATVIAYFCKTVMFEIYIYKRVQQYSIFSRFK